MHIDYAGPFQGRMFLLLIDAHSKWLDIYPSNSSTSSSTIESLRKSFATFGLPEVLVSDNAQAFVSAEFTEFLKKNGIKHIRTPPYHPASNGLVERAVQTFKEGMRRLKTGAVETRLARFLLQYCVTPHSSTGTSPSELMMGRKLRTQLDLLRPSTSNIVHQSQERQKKAHDRSARPRHFTAGDNVYYRNYRQGPSWLPGVVVDQEGSVLFKIRLPDGKIVRRHVDQLRQRVASEETGSGDELGDRTEEVSLPIPESSPPETGTTTAAFPETTEPRVPEPPPESHEGPPNTPETGSLQEPELSEQSSPVPALRRSSRVRLPPERFEQSSH